MISNYQTGPWATWGCYVPPSTPWSTFLVPTCQLGHWGGWNVQHQQCARLSWTSVHYLPIRLTVRHLDLLNLRGLLWIWVWWLNLHGVFSPRLYLPSCLRSISSDGDWHPSELHPCNVGYVLVWDKPKTRFRTHHKCQLSLV